MSDNTERLTLADLAPRPLWVAWQTEDRGDGKPPTKVPYAPHGGKAMADKPQTWGKRPDAERRAAKLPKPYGLGGIGIEFSPLGDGRSLAGIDLDACRHTETKAFKAWAEDVLASFDSYAEISPSQTGAKVFFTFDTDAWSELKPALGSSKFGKQFKNGGGEHPPAIELHLSNRYFTVTDDLLEGSRPDLRHVSTSTILNLIQVVGPNFAQSKTFAKPQRGPSASADRSRSADAFRVGKRAVMDGATFEAMCDALRADPATGDWMREKGEAADFREARRIFEKAKEAGPIIRVAAGELHTIATAGEAAIIAAKLPVYQRGNALVRPGVQEVPAADGKLTVTAALHEIGTHGLVDTLCGCATWERFDARAEDWLRINPPKQVAEVILSRAGLWKLPAVVGVITCPTLRPDGSVLAEPGYDPATRLYHAADHTLRLHPAVARPTRAAAESALALLRSLLNEFPFADAEGATQGVSQAVALSGLITPVVRGALSVSPLHAFRANTAGSGKSYLVDIASTIATGRLCPVATAAADEAETEKRIAGLLLAGFPIASLDNVNGELGGDLLCQAIERPLIRIRRLGASDIVEVESRATLFATGNAMRVRGDMTRRTLVSDLDAGMERPETRKFRSNPVEAVMADRGRYVSACLVIVRAYLLAGSPEPMDAIASFGDWSRLVRSALTWLGCADPAASMEVAREDDPELGELREVAMLWRESFELGEAFTARRLADMAEEKLPSQIGEPVTARKRPDWFDCLNRLAGERGAINTRRLAIWLRKREGRIVDGHRVVRGAPGHGDIAQWKIVKL
jgi:hypothetical protein